VAVAEDEGAIPVTDGGGAPAATDPHENED
jgi:hypothetical protein